MIFKKMILPTLLMSLSSLSALANSTYYTCSSTYSNGDKITVKMIERESKNYILDIFFKKSGETKAERLILAANPQKVEITTTSQFNTMAIWESKAMINGAPSRNLVYQNINKSGDESYQSDLVLQNTRENHAFLESLLETGLLSKTSKVIRSLDQLLINGLDCIKN
jgi:hypothetical protein